MRIDKWLWAARFYKTRSLAVEAIDGGHVSVNGERTKPAKNVQAGDRVEVRKPPFVHDIVVKGLSERRGPAPEARKLYEETPGSRERRAALATEMRATAPPKFKGRPTKKDRRAYERWLRGDGDDEDD